MLLYNNSSINRKNDFRRSGRSGECRTEVGRDDVQSVKDRITLPDPENVSAIQDQLGQSTLRTRQAGTSNKGEAVQNAQESGALPDGVHEQNGSGAEVLVPDESRDDVDV